MLDVISFHRLCIKAVYARRSLQKFINNKSVAKSLKETYVKILQCAVQLAETSPLIHFTGIEFEQKRQRETEFLFSLPAAHV